LCQQSKKIIIHKLYTNSGTYEFVVNEGEDDDNKENDDAIRTFGNVIMKIEEHFSLMLIFL